MIKHMHIFHIIIVNLINIHFDFRNSLVEISNQNF